MSVILNSISMGWTKCRQTCTFHRNRFCRTGILIVYPIGRQRLGISSSQGYTPLLSLLNMAFIFLTYIYISSAVLTSNFKKLSILYIILKVTHIYSNLIHFFVAGSLSVKSLRITTFLIQC